MALRDIVDNDHFAIIFAQNFLMYQRILYLFLGLTLLACSNMNNKHKYTNALINETSPYLLQHAHNPVNWYAWNDETLAKAEEENKMLIISVGYAACHWCHVMEHESFEDEEIAKIMNENFICVKIDREERPDIDDVYMTACQMISGRGCGWPLNAFALPDGRPVWAGTYFPKDEWSNILNQFVTLKKDKPDRLEETANQIVEGIRSQSQLDIVTEDKEYTAEELQLIGTNFIGNIDFVDGGRKGAPKFPMPNNYEFLLKYHYLLKDQRALDAVTITLERISNGGIYDQIGGGYARYSVDGQWFVPHFEKMLYDNGQLVSLNAQAYKLTNNPFYAKKIRQTTSFIERELMSDQYGFYSSLDADSEGVEGKFYVWTENEIDSIITDKRSATIFKSYYSVIPNGNWEHSNILDVSEDVQRILEDHDISEKELENIIDKAGAQLMAHRNTRVRPGLDDKILCSWNALMLKGYIDTYEALGDEKYLDLALKNAHFIKDNLVKKDFRIDRNYKNGSSSINGFLDDYGLTIQAFTALYQATLKEEWLQLAKSILDYSLDHFYNEESKMFNYTSDLDPPLVAKKAELSDNVIPASNSIMARNLFALGTYFYDIEYLEKSEQMLKNMLPQFADSPQPNFYSNWCQLYIDYLQAPYEIAIIGKDAERLRKELSTHYLGNAMILGGTTEGSLTLLKDKLDEEETRIYVCQNKVCKYPVTTVEEALKLME